MTQGVQRETLRPGDEAKHEAAAPWLLVGAAVAAGFALGRRDRSRARPQPEASRPIERPSPQTATDTADLPLGALVGRLLADAVRPTLNQLLAPPSDRYLLRGRQITTATDASWRTGAGTQALGFDSPPITSSYLSNPEVAGVEHAGPYYPPGGAPDGQSLRPNRAVEPDAAGERS
jgi:hypothetical protein